MLPVRRLRVLVIWSESEVRWDVLARFGGRRVLERFFWMEGDDYVLVILPFSLLVLLRFVGEDCTAYRDLPFFFRIVARA
jgi:hypothetical protein